MTTTDRNAALIEALAVHELYGEEGGDYECSCGVVPDPEELERAFDLNEFAWHRSHLARALAPLLTEWRVAAWDEGALWAAAECGAITAEAEPWLAPGDNPYRDALNGGTE